MVVNAYLDMLLFYQVLKMSTINWEFYRTPFMEHSHGDNKQVYSGLEYKHIELSVGCLPDKS